MGRAGGRGVGGWGLAGSRCGLQALSPGLSSHICGAIPRSPLPGKFRPALCHLPQVSEGPGFFLGGAVGISPLSTCPSVLPTRRPSPQELRHPLGKGSISLPPVEAPQSP